MSGERTRLGQAIVVRPIRTGDQAGVRGCKGGTLEQVDQQVRWTAPDRGPGVLEHLVAEVDGQVVGTAMLMLKGAHASVEAGGQIDLCRKRVDPHVGRLDDWVVAGDHQRQGVGSALGRAVIAEAQAWGLVRLETSTENPAAAAAMRKLGFIKYGRLPLLPERSAPLARKAARGALLHGSMTTNPREHLCPVAGG
ncbi:GNAT family N-acetyltransferase [Actinopolymorpha pittospori]|uniref:GNAT superfamily N-acetyltransferase n=1 Tax=Actinopolymorpha pittospori TaxID=648752 RepID=A0A927R7M4_9ACTN|nr:GNAT superfamily N-acetyltransferase [Actinopolymorpha pittospori]